MKNKQRFIFPILIALSVAALAMKKFMIPFHSFFLIAVFDGMALFFFLKAFRAEKIEGGARGRSFKFDLSSIIYGICSIAILYRLEYWKSWERWIAVAGILFLIVSGFMIYSFVLLGRWTNRKKNLGLLLTSHLPWLYFVVIFTPVSLCNPRSFHNLFNGSTYESYVRTRYTADDATKLVERYKPRDEASKKKADDFLHKAEAAEKQEDYEKALDYYNESIDLNPDQAIAVYERGRLKLTRLEISSEMAQSACDDFSRAIQLDSTMAYAYYHRAVAHNFLFPKKRLPTRLDLLKAQELDTTLENDQYVRNFLALPLKDSIDYPAVDTGGDKNQ